MPAFSNVATVKFRRPETHIPYEIQVRHGTNQIYHARLVVGPEAATLGAMVQYDLAVADVPPYDLPEEKRYKQVLALLEQQRKKDDAIFSDKRDPSNMWSHEQLEYFLRWSAEIIVADSYFRYFGCSVV